MTATPPAASGPWLVSVTVNATVAPSFGVERSTTIARPRSAWSTVTAALATSFAATRSAWLDAVTVAVDVSVLPPVPAATVAERTSVALAPFARAPTVHTPVPLA